MAGSAFFLPSQGRRQYKTLGATQSKLKCDGDRNHGSPVRLRDTQCQGLRIVFEIPQNLSLYSALTEEHFKHI
jgi:hypothetical protein